MRSDSAAGGSVGAKQGRWLLTAEWVTMIKTAVLAVGDGSPSLRRTNNREEWNGSGGVYCRKCYRLARDFLACRNDAGSVK
jgi:hypothetical protein